MIPPKCDFCASSDVRWTYPARNVKIPEVNAESVSGWTACGGCHDCIERGDREGLASRADEGNPEHRLVADALGVPHAIRMERLRAIHGYFFRARAGPAAPFLRS